MLLYLPVIYLFFFDGMFISSSTLQFPWFLHCNFLSFRVVEAIKHFLDKFIQATEFHSIAT